MALNNNITDRHDITVILLTVALNNNKTDRHDITDHHDITVILLKMTLNTITPSPLISFN